LPAIYGSYQYLHIYPFVQVLLKKNASEELHPSLFEMRLFSTNSNFQSELNEGINISKALLQEFKKNGIQMCQKDIHSIKKKDSQWLIIDNNNQHIYTIRNEGKNLSVYKAKEMALLFETKEDYVLFTKLQSPFILKIKKSEVSVLIFYKLADITKTSSFKSNH